MASPDQTPESVDSTPMAAPVRTVDVLFAATQRSHSKALASHTSTPCSEPTSNNAIILCDRRIFRITGSLVHSDILSKALSLLPHSIEGMHVKTIPIVSDDCRGMAVNASETLMVVACAADDEDECGERLYWYSLPDGELLRTIGGFGNEGGQFCCPTGVAFGPDDVIIVADMGNNRLQLLSSTGAFMRDIGLGAKVQPVAVEFNNAHNMIAVGNIQGGMLLDYDSGSVLRTLSEVGGVSIAVVSAIRFTRDDNHVLLLASGSPPDTASVDGVLMFDLSDGSFVRRLCTDYIPTAGGSSYQHGLDITDSGDVIVCDSGANTVWVYGGDGDVIVRSWGSEGDGDGEFQSPIVLSYVNRHLYVLDNGSQRVQVFE